MVLCALLRWCCGVVGAARLLLCCVLCLPVVLRSVSTCVRDGQTDTDRQGGGDANGQHHRRQGTHRGRCGMFSGRCSGRQHAPAPAEQHHWAANSFRRLTCTPDTMPASWAAPTNAMRRRSCSPCSFEAALPPLGVSAAVLWPVDACIVPGDEL